MNSPREDIFWDLIDVLDKSGFLRNIMVIGSWAEYLYANYFEDNFLPNIRTHDIDVYYINPFLEIEGAENLRWALRKSGFIFYENPGAGSLANSSCRASRGQIARYQTGCRKQWTRPALNIYSLTLT